MDINLDMYVFTTRFVIRDNSHVVYVIHDMDGDWQFLGKEEGLKEEDALLISLREMLEFDSTLQSIISLPLGQEAVRVDIGKPWQFNNT